MCYDVHLKNIQATYKYKSIRSTLDCGDARTLLQCATRKVTYIITVMYYTYGTSLTFVFWSAGDARTQSPPIKNYAPESPSLGDRKLQHG